MMNRATAFAVLLLSTTMLGCGRQGADAPQAGAPAAEASLVSYESFTLDNGLTVLFHIDRSDPVIAVALTANVGSAREKPGRTGFAHLFEHLLFLESENLGPGGLDAMSARIGGSGANGSTSRDRTNYLQTVPKDALEKMIWAEADKLGWFINTVTEPVLAKEKQVVKNEKRQGVDNQPYGHTQYVIDKALYPADHPYSWQVIGSLEDLDAATLDDVKEFYRALYTPNNVTLSIAGDFDPAVARAMVEKYFAEIPRGPEIAALEPRPGVISETTRLYHEDKFAQLPELTLAWPTAPEHHPDHYALNVLAGLLADGKSAPLNEVLIDEKRLAAFVEVFGYDSALAGQTMIVARAFEGVDLDAVKAGLDEAFARFETEGVAEKDLARIKTTQEVAAYGAVATVLGKAVALGELDAIYGDPAIINRYVPSIRAVTADDVMRVYETYIKGKPYVATSFVPQGAIDLALEGSARADVVEEPIVQGAEAEVDLSAGAEYARTPSSFDRSAEPPYGDKPLVTPPPVWRATLQNGLAASGVVDRETPLAAFEIAFDGGHYLDDPERPGAANLLAEIMTKGTASRSTADLEEAITALGARISVAAGEERFVISGTTLSRNFAATIDLVAEILLEPRWDAEELSLAKDRVVAGIQSAKASPVAVADAAYARATFGEGHVLATDIPGTEASVAALTMDDLKAYHAANLSPAAASLRIVGDIDKAGAMAAFEGLAGRWPARAVAFPDYPAPIAPEASRLVFVDMPGASQSVFRFGHPALTRDDPDFYAAGVVNYRLGGGGFASRLTQELREGKGYTYGVGTGFSGTRRYGDFQLGTGVRANVTLEAALLAKSIMEDYAETFTEEDLAVTKSFTLKSKARAFETFGGKLGMLTNIAEYGYPDDYVARQDALVEAMSLDDAKALATRLIRPDAMTYVIVGDAATQASRLAPLGLGAPVMMTMDE